MEQAINTWSKGLQMDTNPMVQGNETLSNALNATFVTMNGNEVILQNDMGNRRVDNAYLPSGYEPVGIKEYGGVIYLALYNPITNRSQIGSFPSPERKIGEEVPNLGESFSLVINGNDPYTFTSTEEKGIKYLKEDSLLIPLTKDTSLHTGDKFSVYCENLWDEDIKKLLTNFDNIISEGDTKKLLSPKNKLFTLSLGILNSQNEFVDITSSLERWNEENKIIEFEDTDSELYKFNKGYFIANKKPEGIEIKTLDDRELIKNRLSMAANTYSYKLVGPLYLKLNYNHISSINYNISGSKTKDRNNNITAYLEVTTHIEYNCPDGLIDGNGGNNIYYDFETKIPENLNFHFYPFYFLKLNKNNEKYEIVKEDDTSGIIGNITYNPDTNLYSVDIINYYSDVHPSNLDETIIDYIIGVPSVINNNKISKNTLDSTYFIKGLSQEGKIDISKLGSGSVSLDEWRFNYNEETSIGIINYGFLVYAKIGYAFKNLLILFMKCSDNNNVEDPNDTDSDKVKEKVGNENYNWITIEERNFTHGTYIVNNTIKDYMGHVLEDKTMYNVYIRYENYSEETTVSQIIYHNTVQWFATIDIFNNDTHFNFNDINEYVVKDSKINYTFNPEISIQKYDENLVTGDLYSIDSPEGDKYIINNPIKFNTELKNNMEISIGKVPENITITPSDSAMKINFPSANDTTVDIKEQEGEVQITDINNYYEKNLSISGECSLNSNLIISYTGKINQFMYAEKSSNKKSFNIEHNFINFGKYLDKFGKEVWFKPPWIGIESYDGLVEWWVGSSNSSFVIKVSNDPLLESNDYLSYELYRFKNSSGFYGMLKTTTNYNILNNAFNALANKNQTFIVADCQDWFKDNLGIQDKPGGKRRHCCLVWMRYRLKNDLEDKWMLVCEIVLTKYNDDQERADPRIVWEHFKEYFRRMNYYSDFSNDTETLNVYVYNENNLLFIKELLWNINLSIQYKTNLKIDDNLMEDLENNKTQKRVNFKLEKEQLNVPIKFPITINSSLQKNNSGFITYVTNKKEEVRKGQIDYYCKDCPSINNLKTKHLYQITGNVAKEVGVPNSTNMPYFPVTTEKYPDFYLMNEENADISALDFKGVPVIEGLHKYKYYNLDRTQLNEL